MDFNHLSASDRFKAVPKIKIGLFWMAWFEISKGKDPQRSMLTILNLQQGLQSSEDKWAH